MKNNKKLFLLTETVLAAAVLVLAFLMFHEKNGKDRDKVSVIVRNSEDSQWSAFKYGLKMAAEDQDVELSVASTGDLSTAEEEKRAIEHEIGNGADAVIVQPVPGAGTEEMLKKFEVRVPVMLVEYAACEDRDASALPTVEPDNYGMGKALAGELLEDYSGMIGGKTLGIFSQTDATEAAVNRRRGFLEAIRGMGAEISWSVCALAAEERKKLLRVQPKVDVVIALDDGSLVTAAECSAANNLHGALVYGIGNSTEAVYHLDTGAAECLVVPDEFSVGYQSMTEAAESLRRYYYEAQDQTVSYTVLRTDTLFLKENQEILFTMCQ